MALPRRYAQVINAALRDRPADMAVTIHTCRGNFKSAWVAEGGYDPVVEAMFSTDVDGYFMEFDNARAGGFEPLRRLPPGKKVVLGLVTTKLGELETDDALKRRIDEAAQIVPLEQLCLSARNAAFPAPTTATRCRRTTSGASWSAWSRWRARSGADPAAQCGTGCARSRRCVGPAWRSTSSRKGPSSPR